MKNKNTENFLFTVNRDLKVAADLSDLSNHARPNFPPPSFGISIRCGSRPAWIDDTLYSTRGSFRQTKEWIFRLEV